MILMHKGSLHCQIHGFADIHCVLTNWARLAIAHNNQYKVIPFRILRPYKPSAQPVKPCDFLGEAPCLLIFFAIFSLTFFHFPIKFDLFFLGGDCCGYNIIIIFLLFLPPNPPMYFLPLSFKITTSFFSTNSHCIIYIYGLHTYS